MKISYCDITSRIEDEICWWTEAGVPRFEAFTPDICSSVYAKEVVLLKICCQDCKKEFLVEMYQERFLTDHSIIKNVELWIKRDKNRHRQLPLHYGDPPNHGCVGDTMNCYDLKIEEFWNKENMKWIRIPAYEVELEKMEEI